MRVILVVLVLLLPRGAEADQEYADSIEWRTADAQLVAIGRVVSFTRRDDGQLHWYRVRFAIEDTLEGAPRATVDFMVRHYAGDSPADWRARNARLLVFLVDSKRRVTVFDPAYGDAPFALREMANRDDDVVELDRNLGRAYTSNFDLVTTRSALIGAIRRATRSRATAAELLRLDAAHRPGWLLPAATTLWLRVPLDAATELLAKRWIESSERDTQLAGVAVLVHFASPANATLLLPLVDDPVVGARIHRALLAWGVPHATAPRPPQPEPPAEPTAP